MIKQLKHILVNIARLPSVDQRWILRRLSNTELKTLNQWDGLKLLQDAQRFRTLKAADLFFPQDVRPPVLPAFCRELAGKAPLFVAIIIEQCKKPWTVQFLQNFDGTGIIQAALTNQVRVIKPMVKQAVLCEWEQSISFEHLLDDAHG